MDGRDCAKCQNSEKNDVTRFFELLMNKTKT